MLSKDQEKDLLDFAKAIAVPLSNTDADKWPIRAGRVGKLCLAELSKEFFDDIQALKDKNWTIEKIAKLFNNPSHLWPMAHHLLTGLKMNNLSQEDQQQAILTFISLVKNLKYGNPFCLDKKNIVWEPKEVDKYAKKIVNKSSPASSKLVHGLSGIMWSYAESLYFVANDIALEIHGPYQLANGDQLLVRDLFFLHPNKLWPQIKSFLPFESIKILTVYSKFDAWLDAYNNLYLNPGMSLIKNLTTWAVLVDGKQVSESEILQLSNKASKPIEEISSLVDSWDIRKIAKQYIRLFWYRKYALSNAIGKNWEPPQEILKRADTEEIPDPAAANPTFAELKQKFTLA